MVLAKITVKHEDSGSVMGVSAYMDRCVLCIQCVFPAQVDVGV